jgi:DegV family protein with EDD domain
MTRIIADTTSGLSGDTARRLGIPLVPQIIHFGEESFREGVDIDQVTFLKRLKTDRELPRTAAPFPGDFIAAFGDTMRAGESIVCIFPSVEVSGTVRSAMTAREEFPGADIRIIDSRTVAGPLATIVLEADRAAKAGATADEVEALIAALIPRARIYFLVDTLEYLQRGGRIGGAQALLGSILQVKPILAFRDGHIEPYEKARTKSRALARLKELVLAEADRGSEARLTVMHSDAPGEASALASDLQAALHAPSVMIMDLVPAIVTHAGPGTLAVGFFAPPSP